MRRSQQWKYPFLWPTVQDLLFHSTANLASPMDAAFAARLLIILDHSIADALDVSVPYNSIG